MIIGKNELWKQEANIGRKNNQNFCCIPHAKFIEMLKYKGELVGIDVECTDESYTSKCSFFDLEELCHHEEYIGKRGPRGIFRTDTRKINSDVNGSYNIIRKVVPDAFVHGIEGLPVNPIALAMKLKSKSFLYFQ